MNYEFQPGQTRGVSRKIAAAFPLNRAKEPMGLDVLFDILSQLDPSVIGRWGRTLSAKELDLLCRFFHRSTRVSVILAIALLLAHLKDKRGGPVLRYFLLLLPSDRELEVLQTYWRPLEIADLIAADMPWISKIFESDPIPDLVSHLMEELRSGELSLADLETDFHQNLPLFDRLVHFIFMEGGHLLAQIQPEKAAVMVMTFLEEGLEDRVLAYLNYYPEEKWKPKFMETLFEVKGPPDPRTELFYSRLDKGRLWQVRRKMFQTRLEAMSGFQLELWQRWLHRCTNFRWIQGVAHIYIHPLKVVEETDRSLVFMIEQPLVPIETIDRDGLWVRNLEAILAEYIRWGYHV